MSGNIEANSQNPTNGEPTKLPKKRGRPLGSKNNDPSAKRRKNENGEIIEIDGDEGTHPPSRYTHSTIAKDFTEESKRRIENGTSSAKDSEKDAKLDPEQSPFVTTTASWKVTVPPVTSHYPLEGVLAHYISPLLLTWHPQLDGILLAYNNAKLHTKPPRGSEGTISENEEGEGGRPMAQAVDECAAPYVWLTLECLVFKPRRGVELEGYISLQNESQVTLILWNYFTVTIDARRLPTGWIWHDFYDEEGNYRPHPTSIMTNGDVAETTEGAAQEEDRPMHRDDEAYGTWYDAQSREVTGFLKFKIHDWDCAPPGTDGEGSFLTIYGSCQSQREEEEYERSKEVEREARATAAAARQAKATTPLVSALKGGSSSKSSPTQVNGEAGKKRGRPPKQK